MIPAADADALILSHVRPLTAAAPVPLSQAAGRVLAADVTSRLDFPHWDNSAMDGYAVRYADVQTAAAETPVMLKVIEEIPAGGVPQSAVGPGQAARILTGSMMPAGADTVVMQEVSQRSGDTVTILAAPEAQAFVRHRASFYRAGAQLLAAGCCLGPAEIAVLAAAQCVSVPVYRRPRVALLSTGSELVAPEQSLQPGQIVDSNQYALAALVQQAGAEALCRGIVPDQPAALKGAIAAALAEADLVISSGGVSVGDYDYVDRVLGELGGTLHIRAVAVQPGKPLTFATFAAAPAPAPLYFGLPGNPVSALVGFWRFVEPALRKLSGQADGWLPAFIPAIASAALSAGGQRETYLWGQLCPSAAGLEFRLAAGSRSSGNLINLAGVNALAVVPQGQRQIQAGAVVQVMPVGKIFSL
jgi:molybdopterin molybdotransferase